MSAQNPPLQRPHVQYETCVRVETVQLPNRRTSAVRKHIVPIEFSRPAGNGPVSPFGVVVRSIAQLLGEQAVKHGRTGLVEADAKHLGQLRHSAKGDHSPTLRRLIPSFVHVLPPCDTRSRQVLSSRQLPQARRD